MRFRRESRIAVLNGKKKKLIVKVLAAKCTLGTSSIRITQELVRDLSLRHQRLTESRCVCTCGAWNGTHI